MKKCPYCAEEIQDDAAKCKHCGEWLNRENKGSSVSTELRNLQFPKIRPGYMAGVIFLIFETLRNFIGQTVLMTIALLAVLLIGVVYWCMSLYKLHKIVLKLADNQYPISPSEAVGFQYVPFYNFYWLFKWPSEMINFINTRDKSRRLKTWLPGLILLVSSLAAFFYGFIWFIGYFSVLGYLIYVLKRNLAAEPHPTPYKIKTTLFPLWLIVGLPVLLIVIAGILIIPMSIKAVATRRRAICLSNLKTITMAKEMWALDTQAKRNKIPTWSDLAPYLNKQLVCPLGGRYEIGDINSSPTCSVGDNGTKSIADDHILPY